MTARLPLKPAPVAAGQFDYDPASRTFTAEISSTHGFGRVWDDAADVGLTILGRTEDVVFVVVDEKVDAADGDTQFWTLGSVTGTRVDGRYTLTLFND